MPIYEYACEKCEHQFEVEQRITEDPVKTCPACRSRKVKRLISRTSFVLKGSGWYSDLYSSNDAKKPEKKPEGGGSGEKSSEKSSDKADSKPASESKSDGKSDAKGGDSKDGGGGKAKGKGSKAAA
jgi:putative FmdB family regulatory protein